jgi:hypothetical protein
LVEGSSSKWQDDVNVDPVERATGLELLEVFQLEGLNHFSGCILVRAAGGLSGTVFFRDGGIIHAEAGDLVGEQAFHALSSRPDAAFVIQQNVTTTRRTVHRGLQELLAETQRRRDAAARAHPASAPASPGDRQAGVVERLRQVPGVLWAAIQRRGARPDDAALPDERSADLRALAELVGVQLRAGEVAGASVAGANRSLLLLVSKAYHLFVLFLGGQRAGPIEAEIRRMLAPRR